ncbi:hypothetical protein BALOs_0743 [Halobacteriovorax sp. BALOs_7]|uniref:hypothetical protein n=1 Tax=Halobacteriovorax sp. BALOs_7 TaxID=2109558 RepID=UPI000EA02E7B|nr:hypothetical protein [Halobacteriovorax sp. BALOs_7]AYF43753.1 hypothetical protein BALOs_0743 [Halobacteriovorax sp. BALOs_7]
MDTTKKLEILADTIPQLYKSDAGKEQVSFVHGETTISRFSFRPLTPDLKTYKNNCIKLIKGAEEANYHFFTTKSDENRLRELFALQWLSLKTGIEQVKLMGIIDYFYKLSSRTNENSFISKNVIIDLDISVDTSITNRNLQNFNIDKAIDLLASGPFTYLLCSCDLEILEFSSANLSEVMDSTSYKFYPEFLHVLASLTTERKVLFSLTGRGDLVVLMNEEMIASKRRGAWTVYDPRTFKNSMTDILADYRTGCNIYELLFDLSYKRHGGLIIFDSEDNFSNYIEQEEEFKNIFNHFVPDCSFKNTVLPVSAKRRLIELSSVDGAMVVNSSDGKLLGFGKIVKTHHDCPGQLGARTTAAFSACLYGGKAFKVSSDGDITSYFKATYSGDRVNKIKFL